MGRDNDKNCKHCNAPLDDPQQVFCTFCGKRLIEVKVVRGTRSSRFRLRVMVLGSIAILLMLIYYFVYPFFTYQYPPILQGQDLKTASYKLKDIDFRREARVYLSEEELNSLYNVFIKGSSDSIPRLGLSITSDNLLAFTAKGVMTQSILESVPVTVVGMPKFVPENSPNGTYREFVIYRVLVGDLQVPSKFYKDLVPFFKIFFNKRAKELMGKITGIQVNKPDGITIKVRYGENSIEISSIRAKYKL